MTIYHVKVSVKTVFFATTTLLLSIIAVLIASPLAIGATSDQNTYVFPTQKSNPGIGNNWYQNHRFYLELKGGYALGTKGKYDMGDADADLNNNNSHVVIDTNATKNSIGNAPSYGAEVGFNISPLVRVATSYDLFYKFTPSFDTEDRYGNPYSHYSADAYSNVFMLNAYFDLNGLYDLGRFNPYVMVGTGVAMNKLGTLTENNTYSGKNWQTTTDGSTTDSFAWQAGLGSRYALTDHFYIDAGYRYINLGKFESGTQRFDNTGKERTLTTPITIKNVSLNQLYAGLIYMF